MALKYNGSRTSCPASVFPKSAPSEGGNAVTVDQSCQLFPCLAHRAVVGGAADIIGEVLLYGENALDREAFTFINRGEDGCDTCGHTAVIPDSLDGGAGR